MCLCVIKVFSVALCKTEESPATLGEERLQNCNYYLSVCSSHVIHLGLITISSFNPTSRLSASFLIAAQMSFIYSSSTYAAHEHTVISRLSARSLFAGGSAVPVHPGGTLVHVQFP